MSRPFVCDLNAMSTEERARYRALAVRLGPAVLSFEELANGYAARFAPSTDAIALVAEFIALERLCCPFFELTLRAAADDGPLWLEITGAEGVKPFVRAELGIGTIPA